MTSRSTIERPAIARSMSAWPSTSSSWDSSAGSPAASSGSVIGRPAIRSASLRAIVATQGCGRSGVWQLSWRRQARTAASWAASSAPPDWPRTPCASRRHCARTRPQSHSATNYLVERCNELNAQEGLPSMNLTLESDSARGVRRAGPCLRPSDGGVRIRTVARRHRVAGGPARARGPAPAGRRVRDRQELHAAAGPRLRRHGVRHLAGDGGRGAGEGRGARRRAAWPTCGACRSSASTT